MERHFRAGGLAVLIIAACAGPVSAEDPDPHATFESRYAEGQRLYQEGKFTQANAVFQEALDWFGGRQSPLAERPAYELPASSSLTAAVGKTPAAISQSLLQETGSTPLPWEGDQLGTTLAEREMELIALKEQLTHAEEALETAQGPDAILDQRVQQQQRQLEAKQAKLIQLQRRLNSLEQTHTLAQNEVRQLRNLMTVKDTELSRLQANSDQLVQLQREMTALRDEVIRRERQTKDAEALLEQKRAVVDQLTDDLEQQRQRVAQMDAVRAQQTQELDAAKAQIQRLVGLRDQEAQRFSALSASSEQIQDRLAQTEIALAQQAQEAEGGQAQVERLIQMRDQQDARVAELVNQLQAAHHQNQLLSGQLETAKAHTVTFDERLQAAQADFTKGQSLWRLEREQLNNTRTQQERELSQVKEQFAQTQSDLIAAQQEQMSLRERLADRGAQLEAKSAELAETGAALRTAERAHSTAQGEAQQLRRVLTVTKEELARLSPAYLDNKRTLEQVSGDHRELAGNHDRLAKEYERLEIEHRYLQDQLREIKQDRARLTDTLTSTQRTAAAREQQLREFKEQGVASEQETQHLRSNLLAGQEEIKRLRQAMADDRVLLQQVSREYDVLRIERPRLKEKAAQLEGALQELTDEVATVRKQLAASQSERDQFRATAEQRERELAKLQSDAERLQQRLAGTTRQLEKVDVASREREQRLLMDREGYKWLAEQQQIELERVQGLEGAAGTGAQVKVHQVTPAEPEPGTLEAAEAPPDPDTAAP